MVVPLRPNERWSLDFVSDQFTDGRRFRILVIVIDCTRENLALVADTSLSGLRNARELDRVVAGRGGPLIVVSNNGGEFTAMRSWHGQIRPASDDTIPRPASRCRTASSRALLAACEPNS